MAKKNELTTTTSTAIFADPFTTQFSSFIPEDMAAKAKLFNAINAPDKRLTDMINKDIAVKDVILVKVKLADEREPGDDAEPNERDGVRTILIDEDGVSYSATSNGIFNSVQLIRNVFGTLHFEEPLTVTINQVSAKRGKTLTLAVKG